MGTSFRSMSRISGNIQQRPVGDVLPDWLNQSFLQPTQCLSFWDSVIGKASHKRLSLKASRS